MESLQIQVSALNQKVEGLHQVIEQLSSKIAQVLSEPELTAGKPVPSVALSVGRYHYSSYSSLDISMEHKDVLVDANRLERNAHSSEQELSPEIQIQRLTAQLTAAYNRIAALEEQLLAQRIH